MCICVLFLLFIHSFIHVEFMVVIERYTVCVSIANCYPWDANGKPWFGRSNINFIYLVKNKHKISTLVCVTFVVVEIQVKQNECYSRQNSKNPKRRNDGLIVFFSSSSIKYSWSGLILYKFLLQSFVFSLWFTFNFSFSNSSYCFTHQHNWW